MIVVKPINAVVSVVSPSEQSGAKNIMRETVKSGRQQPKLIKQITQSAMFILVETN